MAEDILVAGARTLGIEIGERERARFAAYTDLLNEWNTKLNLTRITDPAPMTSDLKPRRDRGVRCIRFVRRSSRHRNRLLSGV